MAYTSNRSILEKADMALADLTAGGGILLPAQAQKFMRLLIKQSELMGMATVVPMAAPKQQLPKIKFGSRVLRAGKEATRLSDAERAKPAEADTGRPVTPGDLTGSVSIRCSSEIRPIVFAFSEPAILIAKSREPASEKYGLVEVVM